jgi:general secretion pathway protein G
MARFKSIRAFTLIELLISLAVLAVLAMVALPVVELAVTRGKERELRVALWQIRDALDAYKQAADAQRIARSVDQSGYPPDLRILVEGVVDLKDINGRKIYFLRRIPRDPMHPESDVPAELTWGKRSYRSPASAPQEGADVYDVFSKSEKTGLNGVPYREW